MTSKVRQRQILITNNEMYKKRPGTASAHGQFYESKLLSVLNFRAKHDDEIEEFYLAANVDLIGGFDDICLRVKVKGFAKEMAVFAQIKHKEADKCLSLDVKQDLTTSFQSYIKIRRAFDSDDKGKLFGGAFSETECLFIMYTNAKYYNFNKDLVQTDYTTKLKDLIATGKDCSYLQPEYNAEDVVVLSNIILEEEIVALAEYFGKILNTRNKEVLMDEHVSRYHYILAQRVFEIRDDEGIRIANFRNDFFKSNEHFVLIFKNTLYEQVKRNLKQLSQEKTTLERKILLDEFFSEPSEVVVLSKLIGTVIAYKTGKFEFIIKSSEISEDLKRKLNEVSVPQTIVDEAIDVAARKILDSSKFKVPVSFGNKDLTVKDAKVESVLNKLCSTIVSLINVAPDKDPNDPYTIITIDHSLDKGLLRVNGGLAGAVGNVFVADENSELMKFADNIESIEGNLAKRLYLKLQTKINNLQEYRIKVKVKTFTKHSFHASEHDVNLVKDFLRQLIFFTNQSKQQDIDDTLKFEMRNHPCDGIYLDSTRADAVFLKYHKAIQDWWIKLNKVEYLTKHSQHFEDATKDVIHQSLLSVINMIETHKMQNFKYTFSEAALRDFKLLLDEQCKTNETNVKIIVTDNCEFTVAKLTQNLNDKTHLVLDLEYISNLMPNKTLRTDLVKPQDTVIFVNYGKWYANFNEIVNVVEAPLFIVTKVKPNKMVSYAQDSANKLIDLSDESQQTFLKNTKVIFQEEEINLGIFVKDEEARKRIKGDIFHEMLKNKVFKIGMPLGNRNYDEFKYLYTDRRVSRIKKTEEDAFHEVKDKLIQTLYDLQDHVILLTAMPGMGKSTLLTHLSVKTKELDPSTWIVRINLVEYSKIFSEWQNDKTVIDPEISLHFISRVALGMTEEKITAELQTDNKGNAAITYGLELFLQFYNTGALIFLFDGYDEIFPHYANEALSLVKSVRSYPRQHKIWITSRSYNHIKSILEKEFGRSYDLDGFSNDEQSKYLSKYVVKRMFKPVDLERFINEDETSDYFTPSYPAINSTRYSPRIRLTEPYIKFYFGHTGHFGDDEEYYGNEKVNQQIDNELTKYNVDFFATPLHLHLLSECMPVDDFKYARVVFVRVKAFKLYQHFIETKVNKIRYTEKDKIDTCISNNITTTERDRAYILSLHKKLGAYAVFYPDFGLLFRENELKEIRETIDKLKLGIEKSGFIHSVAGDIPLFIHRQIAEYFATEYIDDLLKSDITDETRKSILGMSKIDEVSEILALEREDPSLQPFIFFCIKLTGCWKINDDGKPYTWN